MLEALREPRRALALAGAYRPLAERALADAPLDPDDALGVLRAPGRRRWPALLWAAYAVAQRALRAAREALRAEQRAQRPLSRGLRLLLAVGGLHGRDRALPR